jgi:hypothetical protein
MTVVIPEVSKPTVSLTAEDYQRIVHQIVFQIKKYERETHETGMHKSALVDWYLESKEAELDSEEQILYQRKLIKSILNRLVKKVSLCKAKKIIYFFFLNSSFRKMSCYLYKTLHD